MDKIKLKDVRIGSPLNNYRYNSFVDHFISSRISPIFTVLFIRLRIIPNTITLLMILAGMAGAILFSFNNIYIKIVGFLFFHFWFILDCSDGEVARITKTFSKYGKEMDFMAHLICHPLMNLSLWYTFQKTGNYSSFYISILFISFISMELVIRSYTLFNVYLLSEKTDHDKPKKANFLKYVIIQFGIYPNFILIFPFFIIVNSFFSVDFSIYVLLFWFGLYSLLFLKSTYNFLSLFYKRSN